MKRKLIFITTMVFTTLLALAVNARAEEPCLKLKKIWTSQDAVRQGGEMTVELRLESKCRFSPLPEQQGQTSQLSLESAGKSGLELRMTGMGRRGVESGSGAEGMLLSVKAKASPETPLGKHEVPVMLKYEAPVAQGQISDRQLQFKIPIKVVAEGASVKTHSPALPKDRSEWSKWNLLWEIPAIVALSPLFIVLSMVGALPSC